MNFNNIRWQKLLVKTTVWLVAEILLTLLGIDHLADYSEFVFEKNIIVLISTNYLSKNFY